MVRFFAVVLLVVTIAGGYVLSPFVAAVGLREAIKAGDTATIERRVIWERVRASLRASIAESSRLLPEATQAAERVRPTMWQRVKTAFGQSMVDRFIESYVTPEGLPKLFRYRNTWNGTVKGHVDDEDKLDALERVKAFYRRLARAEFKSPGRIEIEMIDRFQPDRRYVSTLELHGFEWKLAELRIVGALADHKGPRRARDVIGLQ
jgi:hypothetical protein